MSKITPIVENTIQEQINALVQYTNKRTVNPFGAKFVFIFPYYSRSYPQVTQFDINQINSRLYENQLKFKLSLNTFNGYQILETFL